MSLIQEFVRKCGEKKFNIGVVGDSMVDSYFSVDVSRISPEFPIPVMKAKSPSPAKCLPGGAANVCYQFAHLPVDAHLVSILDECAEHVFSRYNINTNHSLVCPEARVPLKQRFYDEDSPFCRYDIEQEFYGFHEDVIVKLRNGLYKQYMERTEPVTDMLILSDYDKGMFGGKPHSWASTLSTLIDPKGGPLEVWKGCTIFKPNAQEAKALSGGLTDWKDQTIFFLRKLGCESVVITQSAKGVVGWDGEAGDFFEYKNPDKVLPRSVIGAGDCFCAFLSLAYLHGFKISEASEIAFRAATAYVGNIHNHPISLYDLMKSEDPIAAKYMEPKGEKLVFTNGCFDVLHTGHLELLRFAKSKGDKLVVALNSDDSVMRIKGPKRPITPLAERMAVVASLEFVDFVTSFEETDPYKCIEKIRPYSLVKGEDYTLDKIIGRGLVQEVHRCPLVEGRSSTKVIEKINAPWR